MKIQSESDQAKAKIKSMLHAKFVELVKKGMDPTLAFEVLMINFEKQFPGLADKLA